MKLFVPTLGEHQPRTPIASLAQPAAQHVPPTASNRRRLSPFAAASVCILIGLSSSAPAATDPPDGSLVTYLSFDHTTYTLRQFNGAYVALLLNDAQLASAGETFVRHQINRYDQVYDTLRRFLALEPTGDGLLKIAVLPQTLAGAARGGIKGIEITYLFFDDPYQRGRDLLYEVVEHEMCHNFDRYGGYLFTAPDAGHSWTDFMQSYTGFYSREGFTDESSVAPDDWIRIITDRFFGPYLSVPGHSWETCVKNRACGGDPMAFHAQGGLVLRVAQVYGAKAMKAWYSVVKQLVTARLLSPGSMTDLDKVGFLIETLSNAAGENLACFADSIRWPVPDSVRARLNGSLPPSRFCNDSDHDGYSVLQGDFDDTKPSVHPGAAEIVDGLDNDLNGAIDEVLVAETTAFPSRIENALSVPWPTRITGTLSSSGSREHFFEIAVNQSASVRFQLKNTGNFKGYITVYHANGSGYSSEYTELPNAITDLTLVLWPGIWRFSVIYGFSGGPGTYELVVAQALARVDPLLVAATPVRQANGQLRLWVPYAAQEAGRSSAVWFWVSKLGWVGSSPLAEDGTAWLDWTPPLEFSFSQARYSFQYFSNDLPASAMSGVASLCWYSVDPTSTSVAAAGGSGSVNVNCPTGCPWTATSRGAWMTITSGASGNGNGTMSFSVAANPGVSPRTGTLEIAGRAVTVTQLGTAPLADQASPASGSGGSQAFTFTFSDPNGWQDLDVVNVLVNFWLDGRQACYLAYSRPLGVLYLMNDPGTALLQELVLGSAGSVSNSQCTVYGTGSSAVGSGNTLTLTLNIGFQPAFAGTRIIYLAARDVAQGNSGWQRMGAWTVPGAAATSPAVVGMSPARGTGQGPATITFQFSDNDGWQDLGVLNILVNDWLDGRNACYLAYSRPLGVLYLVNDPGTALLPPLVLGSGAAVSNSQCAVYGTGSSATGSGNTLTLTLRMSFMPSFWGNRVFYLAARDVAEHNSGWQALGTWTVP